MNSLRNVLTESIAITNRLGSDHFLSELLFRNDYVFAFINFPPLWMLYFCSDLIEPDTLPRDNQLLIAKVLL